MVVRFYLVPAVGDGTTIATARKPDYVSTLVPAPRWVGVDYGREDVFLLAADVTPAQHTALAAKSPITVVPSSLEATVGANVSATENALESWGIPGHWVTSGMTWRTVLRGVATVMQLAQRLAKRSGSRILPAGVTLATTMAQLTVAQRNALQDAVDSFGWDSSSITGSTTVREFLRAMAAQWSGALPIFGEAL
jgi:hypothetical protein